MQLLWICLGGALGTGGRHLVGLWASNAFGTGFPYGTLLVNALGSFFISVVMFLGHDAGAIPASMRIMLTTGVLGGFTTYSSFNFETLKLFQSGGYTLAAVNVASTLLVCAFAGLLGLLVGSRLAGLIS
jgi:CrcB protein